MIRLLVVADDLTGAVDTGVQFSKQGVFTQVAADLDIDLKSLDPDLQVLVADTESRHVPAPEAAWRVEHIVRAARTCGVTFFYKKTDSTLRGNVGAELEAMLRASGEPVLAFVPAYPETGRFTRQGCQYIGDTPLHRTAFGEDPFEPVTTSSVPEIISRQARCTLSTVFLDQVRSNREISFDQPGIVLFDCENAGDLERIGEMLSGNRRLGATAGSAGFAGMLPGLLQLPRRPVQTPAARGPVLVVNGSLNETSLRQVAFAEKRGIRVITLPQDLLMEPDPQRGDASAGVIEPAAAEAGAGRDLVLRTAASLDEIRRSPADRKGTGNAGRGGRETAERVGWIVSAVLRKSAFKTCAVFGGDTLAGILRALSLPGLRPVHEIAAGVVLSEAPGSAGGLHWVTKAGGFGDDGIVLRIIQFIREGSK